MSVNFEYVKPEWRKVESRAMRDGFGEAMVSAAKDSELVLVLTADLGKSLRLLDFAKIYPDRYFNVGVAEQNMMGVAAGLAMEGFIPVTCSFGVFSPARNWDQVRVSVAMTNSNVKIVGSHAGLSVGENGASHQALEDIAIARVLPNMTVIVPADYTQTMASVRTMVSHIGPVYMRFPRSKNPDFTKDVLFDIGKAYTYREGKDVSVFVSGIHVWDTLVVAEKLGGEGIDIEVINVPSVKPIDEKAIVDSVRKTGRAVSVEDHQIIGGLGSAVAEVLSERYPTPMIRIGMEDKFGESGKYTDLYKKYGLDQEGIYKRIRDFVG